MIARRIMLAGALVAAACSSASPRAGGPVAIANQGEVTPDAAPPDADPREGWKLRYARGERAYNEGDFLAAALDFESLYEEWPVPAILFNIAQARRMNGDIGLALAAYQKLSVDPDANDTVRAAATRAIQDLHANYPPVRKP